MIAPSFSHRQAMTLVELLVVLAILGLLGVAVSPLIQSRDDKQTFRNAADLLSLHFADAAGRAIGETTESGVWLEAETTGAAVTQMSFCKTPTGAAGSTTVTNVDASTTPPTAEVSLPSSPAPAAGSRLRFSGSTSLFEVRSSSQIQMLRNRNLSNDSFPAAGNSLSHEFQIYPPPKKKSSVRSKRLPGNSCVDLQYSYVGINTPGQAPTAKSLGLSDAIAILYDSSGRPSSGWLLERPLLPAASSWSHFPIVQSDPIVLLIGASGQVGAGINPAPTEENPGANIQNPSAIWLILDPKTGLTHIVENNAANNVLDAQKFVRQKLGIE
jgi:prepilin-type N-terminal cleavage/methylation domain-containing protein